MKEKVYIVTCLTNTFGQDPFEETLEIPSDSRRKIESHIKDIIAEFNRVEIRRNEKTNGKYKAAPTRSLNRIINITLKAGSRPSDWNKLIQYTSGGEPLFRCNNTGLITHAVIWPEERIIGKHVCLVCNTDHDTKASFNDHLKGDMHIYCENSTDDRPYLSERFNELQEESLNKLREGLTNEASE